MVANPFTPLFGQVPSCIAGREHMLDEMTTAFTDANSPNKSTLIVGARGTGKTVLLSRVAEIAGQRGWLVAQTSARPGMLEDIIQRTYEAGGHLLRQSEESQVTSIELGGLLGVSWNRDQMQANWRTRMNRVFQQLEETDTGLLITVDEVNASCDDLITLATLHQHFISEGKRVVLFMAGLPSNISGLLNGKTTSFWRRASQYRLGRISDSDIAAALESTFAEVGLAVDESALAHAVEAIDGFPYMMQLVGYWAFEHQKDGSVADSATLSEEDIQAGIERARKALRTSVLDATFSDLSEGDIAFLEAMLPDGESSTMADIARRMGVTQSYASQYRLRLIAQGVIGTRGRGKVAFEIPYFREFLSENLGFAALPEQWGENPIDDTAWRDARMFFRNMDAEADAL